tara:strand:- start:1920 stop:2246 length:327 start_codon:yes stop_codon:yes gene_type:complete
MNVSFIKPYYQGIQRESVMNKHLYNKFLNWVSGEFDLYLQDELNGLEVFFPNGRFTIKSIAGTKKDVLIEINVRSKDLKAINSIGNRILSIHRQIESIYSKPIETSEV